MTNRCPKCKQKLQGSEFLCPNCGHILGQPVYHAPRQKPQRKIPWRAIFGTFGVLMLVCALLAAAWGIQRLDQYWEATGTTPGSTAPPTTAAPLTSYHVQLTAETDYWIEGITVHFCKDGQELYSGQVEADGRITFIAPKGEGYTIRLSNLAPPLAFHYGDMDIPFPDGDTTLSFHMENKPVEYTVRVVNSRGEPLKDVLLEFSALKGNFVSRELTQEDSATGFACAYDPKAQVRILYVPNGYVKTYQHYTFEDGRFNLEIRLVTYEECNIGPEHIYTARFVDENGEPIKDMLVDLISQIPGDPNSISTLEMMTNQEGCIVFDGSDTDVYSLRVSQNPDYYDKPFTFQEGSNELTCTLHLYTDLPEYTYTVYFCDQSGAPIPGVTIFYENNGEYFYETSNQEGQISFPSVYRDPRLVKFRIDSVPAGYKVTSADLVMEYTFKPGSRTLEVELESQTVEYTIWVYEPLPDGSNAGVVGVEFDIQVGEERYSCKTKGTAQCRIELPYLYSKEQFSVELIKLPESYKDYVIRDYTVGGNDDLHYIIIYIAPKPQSITEYKVTVFVPVNDGYKTVQGAQFVLIVDEQRYACETGANGSYWIGLPEISDSSQLRVELTSLPEPYEDYVFLDYEVVQDRIYIFLGLAPEPPVEVP